MKKNKVVLGVTALALVLGAGVATASAYQGDYTKEGPNCTAERSEAMTTAFETTDYNAWLDLMGDKGRVKDVINEDNFARFAEAHVLGKAGDIEGANEIREELGLHGNGDGRMGMGYKGGQGDKMEEGRGQGRGVK